MRFFTSEASVTNIPDVIDEPLSDNKWCHVAMTYKRDTHNVEIYLDGNKVWQKIVPEMPEAIDKPYLYIGGAHWFTTFFRMTGKMACVEIFRYHMNEERIHEVMESCVSFKVGR